MPNIGNTSYALSQLWLSLFRNSLKKYPNKTVFHYVQSFGQTENYDCGAGVITSVLRRIGIITTPIEILETIEQILQASNLSAKDIGTPPYLLKYLLEHYTVHFIEKPSDDAYTDVATLEGSLQILDRFLLTRHICITDIQTTPSYDKNTKISNKNTMDNGHYVLVVGMCVIGTKEYFITLDSAYFHYQQDSWACKLIQPSLLGIRFIEKSLFVKKWHDEEVNGRAYNQWLLAIPLEQPKVNENK